MHQISQLPLSQVTLVYCGSAPPSYPYPVEVEYIPSCSIPKGWNCEVKLYNVTLNQLIRSISRPITIPSSVEQAVLLRHFNCDQELTSIAQQLGDSHLRELTLVNFRAIAPDTLANVPAQKLSYILSDWERPMGVVSLEQFQREAGLGRVAINTVTTLHLKADQEESLELLGGGAAIARYRKLRHLIIEGWLIFDLAWLGELTELRYLGLQAEYLPMETAGKPPNLQRVIFSADRSETTYAWLDSLPNLERVKFLD